MAEQTAHEKTEQPTPKRLREAREKGQVARSKELTTMAVLLASAGGILLVGNAFIGDLLNMMRDVFITSRMDLMDVEKVPVIFSQAMTDTLVAMLPFFSIVTVAALLSPMVLSG